MSSVSRTMVYRLFGFAILIATVTAHGHLSSPVSTDKANTDAPVSFPFASDFVCRNAEPGSTPTTTLTAGSSSTITWTMSAPHPGDCFAYISYDFEAADINKKWIKVAQWGNCLDMNVKAQNLVLPDYLPPCEHCLLRWEWYSLQLQSVGIVEFYAQCSHVKINSARTNAALPTPQVTIPGHMPMDAKFFRDPYGANADKVVFIGPPIATPNGAAYSCSSTYDSSCVTAPVSKNPCTISHQRCLTATTYQACQVGIGATVWGASQLCASGLVCSDRTDGFINCVRPSAQPTPSPAPTPSPSPPVSTPAPSPSPTPSTTARLPQVLTTSRPVSTPTPSTTAQSPPVSTPAPSPRPTTPTPSPSTCTDGHAKCLKDMPLHYSSCDRGVWTPPRICGSNLVCDQSGDFVYCVRP